VKGDPTFFMIRVADALIVRRGRPCARLTPMASVVDYRGSCRADCAGRPAGRAEAPPPLSVELDGVELADILRVFLTSEGTEDATARLALRLGVDRALRWHASRRQKFALLARPATKMGLPHVFLSATCVAGGGCGRERPIWRVALAGGGLRSASGLWDVVLLGPSIVPLPVLHAIAPRPQEADRGAHAIG